MDRRRNPGMELFHRRAGTTIIIAILLALVVFLTEGYAQQVKYCKDLQTGQVVVVEANMPCPYPMVQI